MSESAATDASPPSETAQRHIFVVLNPQSGRTQPDALRETIEQAFQEHGARYTLHTVAEGEDITATVRTAVAEGYTDVVATGGDGTISAVVSALVDTDVRLGIIPSGTANVLARELNIPIDMAQASTLIVAPHKTIRIDAMRLPDRVAVLEVGVGLGSVMVRDTRPWAKRLIGRSAYIWTAFIHLFGFGARRFRIIADGRLYRAAALQVVIANGGVLGTPPFRWGPDIDPSDGLIDVAILRTRTLFDVLKLTWAMLLGRHRSSPNIRYLRVSRTILVAADPPLPVQADGEIIGQTPCILKVIPSAVNVIVPLERSTTAGTVPGR